MLTRAAGRAVDPTPWLRRIADHALQDLQVERVATELERVAALDPDGDDGALESLYRRTDQPERLAELLQRRLLRVPNDDALWDEVIALRYGLDQPELARQLEQQRTVALSDPDRFLRQLPPELRAQAASARRQALSLALAGETDGTILGDVLERLRPFFGAPEFRDAAELLLVRHKNDPAAKPMRIELLDVGRTPIESASAAADLAATYPDDVELVRLWIDRAGWAGLPQAEIDARQRMIELVPAERENRRQLADLLAYVGKTEQAVPLWRELYQIEGVASASVPLLVEALFDLGRETEAVQLLQQLANDPAATTEQRLRAADELFYRRSYDRAKVLYATVLDEQPEHAWALLRMGQIYAWTNDPATARDYFERRLRTTDDDAALVSFHLAEALWATGEPGRARSMMQAALAKLSQLEAPDFTTRSVIATSLARLGRRQEAALAYRDLVARNPRDLDLVLDYVDVLVAEADWATATALLGHGTALDRDNQRLLQLRGELERQRGDLRAAVDTYSRAIELHGVDAGTLAELGQVRDELGDWQGALANYERWLQLQSDNAAAQQLVGELRDRLATAGIGTLRWLSLGSDRVFEATAAVAVPTHDRQKWNVRAGVGSYRGTAAALAGRRTEIEVGLLDVAFEQRASSSSRWGIGLRAAPDAPGDTPIGAFVATQFSHPEPFASLELRGFAHELWTEPAAAPALGGRRSGVDASLYGEMSAGWWVGAYGAFEHLRIEPDLFGAEADVRWRSEVTVGRQLVPGQTAVAAPFDVTRVPAGPISPFPNLDRSAGQGWLASAWLSWQTAVLLDDADLAKLLPISRRDDHALLAGRLDHRFGGGFGCSLSGNVGVDLRGNGEIWGVGLAVSWRPSRLLELTAGASRAAQLGRATTDEVDELRFEGVLRW